MGVREVIGIDCVGEKHVALLRSLGPGAVEGVMAWRKDQGMQVCVTDSLIGAVEANQGSGEFVAPVRVRGT